MVKIEFALDPFEKEYCLNCDEKCSHKEMVQCKVNKILDSFGTKDTHILGGGDD